jgi:hypothetical protein
MPLLIDYLKEHNNLTPKQAAILNGLGILAVALGLGYMLYLAIDIKADMEAKGCGALCQYIEGYDPEDTAAHPVAYSLDEVCTERGYIKNPNPDYLTPITNNSAAANALVNL